MFLAAACVLLGGIFRCFRTKIPVSIVKQFILLYEYSLLNDVHTKLRYVYVRLPDKVTLSGTYCTMLQSTRVKIRVSVYSGESVF